MSAAWVVLLVAVLLFCARPARAHDFWIEPTTFTPVVGDVLGVGLRVGHVGEGDPFVRKPERIVRFVLASPGAADVPLAGMAGDNPAGHITLTRPGSFVLAYQTNRARVTLAGPEFTNYLHEEGLDAILTRRSQRGETNKAANEVYSRSAKSLIIVGPSASAGTTTKPDFALGLSLEIVCESDPHTLKSGGPLPVRLLFRGKPLANSLIAAVNSSEPQKTITATTNVTGRATLFLPRGGMWVLKSVHMIAAPPDANADYESFWASLTFKTL